MTTRDAFLAAVRRELARTGGASPATVGARPADPVAAAAEIRARAGAETDALLARFRAEAERVGTVVHRVATLEAAAALVLEQARARAARRVAAWSAAAMGAAAGIATRLRAAGLEVIETEADISPAEMAAADLGLTGVDLAVAETGSLVLGSGAGKARSVSLLPPCHLAIVYPRQLVPGLAEVGVVLEAWHAAPDGPGANIVLVTGPSRTADIELTLTRGVHGPKEVHAVVVDAD